MLIINSLSFVALGVLTLQAPWLGLSIVVIAIAGSLMLAPGR
jgi:hypothetical protein